MLYLANVSLKSLGLLRYKEKSLDHVIADDIFQSIFFFVFKWALPTHFTLEYGVSRVTVRKENGDIIIKLGDISNNLPLKKFQILLCPLSIPQYLCFSSQQNLPLHPTSTTRLQEITLINK